MSAETFGGPNSAAKNSTLIGGMRASTVVATSGARSIFTPASGNIQRMGLLGSATLAKRYLLWRPVEPPAFYSNRKPFERANLEYADEVSSSGFHEIFSLDLRGKDVLDIGCGYGGRTVYYKEMGARSVFGVEIHEESVREANAFGVLKGAGIEAIVGCGEKIPLPDSSVDVITSYDVFEHVESLPRTLVECQRVLRPSGTLYAVFPPFYHPTGGSHLHGYVSSSPLPNLLFSNAALRRAINTILDERASKWRPSDRPGDALPSVNGTTVAAFLRMLKQTSFARKTVRLKPLKSRRLRYLNHLPTIGTRIPVLREICTSRIECTLTK